MANYRNLLITGGWAHPFDRAAPVLANIIDSTFEQRMQSTVVWDLPDARDALAVEDFDLITVFACWFTMRDPRYSAEQRTTWARSIDLDLRELLLAHRDAGRPLFAMHTATICFDEWPQWGEWLGGQWDWKASYHPPIGDVSLTARMHHPIVSGVGDFTVVDECYSKLNISSSVLRLAEGQTKHHDAAECLLWCKEDRGRVVYDALGHDVASLTSDAHQRLIRQAVAWLLDEVSVDARASSKTSPL